VAPVRSVMVLVGGATEITTKENFPSRTLSPIVAPPGGGVMALWAFEARALVRSKSPASLPPVLIIMTNKTRKTADG
jgi:hypothetical protein